MPDKWYKFPKRETIFNIKHEGNMYACHIAHVLLEQELGQEGILRYNFHESFALDHVLAEALAQNESGTVDVLRSFPDMDHEEKVEAYRALYQYVMDKMDQAREYRSLAQGTVESPVSKMKCHQQALKESHKEVQEISETYLNP